MKIINLVNLKLMTLCLVLSMGLMGCSAGQEGETDSQRIEDINSGDDGDQEPGDSDNEDPDQQTDDETPSDDGGQSADNPTDLIPDQVMSNTDNAFATKGEVVRFLNQSTFGAKQSQLSLLQQKSASQWFRLQVDYPATYLSPQMRQGWSEEQLEDFPVAYAMGATVAFWKNTITAEDQLRQRVAFGLSEILVTSNLGSDLLEDVPEAMAGYQDILIRNAFGNYRALLEEVTYSPVMGLYLTYMGSQKGDPTTGRKPDENYARELLQLFTIGVEELNLDGTAKLDSNNLPIETYDNSDIEGLAKVFTGLNVDEVAIEESAAEAMTTPMQVFEEDHSSKEKVFLGQSIAANTSARASISQALDIIFQHPNVAPFVSTQLIKRLVSSNPSPAYVGRVASAFESGAYLLPDGESVGTRERGDLTATIAAILFDEEARQMPLERGGKIREPIIRFTNWARAFEVENVEPAYLEILMDTHPATVLGQQAYYSPSVFNFFRPGYRAPNSHSGEQGLAAPELQITNATSIPGYINFMALFIYGHHNEEIDEQWLAETPNDLDENTLANLFAANYDAQRALADDPAALVAQLDELLTGGVMTQTTKQHISATLQLEDEESRVELAILMVMTSADFLVQL